MLDKEKVIGSVFAVLATIGAATYKTLFAKFIQSPNVRQVALILSLIGVIDLFIFLPVAFILVHFDFESISYPNAPWDLIIYQGTSFWICFLCSWAQFVNFNAIKKFSDIDLLS